MSHITSQLQAIQFDHSLGLDHLCIAQHKFNMLQPWDHMTLSGDPRILAMGVLTRAKRAM